MKIRRLIIASCFFILIDICIWFFFHSAFDKSFNGDHAFEYLKYQISLGPRIPGSKAHNEIINWMTSELVDSGWNVETQIFSTKAIVGTNLIARRGVGTPWIIIGAHYDSRQIADHDPEDGNRIFPVPGANDGASGVAVLLEIARVLPEDLDKQVWLVFFDQEDQGGIGNQDWILGSKAFVASLEGIPDYVIIVDMVGDADLKIYYERNSNQDLSKQIWSVASTLGFGDHFIPEERHSILDDHTPFLEKGITAIDIIDFDYPYYHSLADTPDKTSAKSLAMVGRTLIKWLSK